MTQIQIQKAIAATTNNPPPWTMCGKYALVHLDNADVQVQEERAARFDPARFFDANCEHCAPFLKDGAVMLYDGDSLVGMRPLGGDLFETVHLLNPGPGGLRQ